MPNLLNKNYLTLSASTLLFAGVGLGAFGAHALRESLFASGHTDTWQTAVQYQLIHGLALFCAGLFSMVHAEALKSILFMWATRLLVAGVVLFSGSLYVLSLGGPRWMGPITPLGGACFLASWACFGIWSLKAGISAKRQA